MTTETPAVVLRRAAEKLREHAGYLELYSIRGPWSVHAGPDGYPQSVSNVGVPILICQTFTDPKAPPVEANWIALMHPGLAEPMAKVFDEWARVGELDLDLLNRMGGQETLALARRVLGEVSS